MNAKEYLERGKTLAAEITALSEALECAHSEAMKITPTGGGERVQSAVRRDRQEAAVLRYTELKADINSRIARLFEIKRELFELVDEIEDPRIRTLIVYRYLNRMTFEAIADKMGYDLRWVYRIHKKALGEVDKLLNG